MLLQEVEKQLFSELLAIADTKFVLGSWYFIALPNGRSVQDWTALCALTQDHYGHARALYRYLARFGFSRQEAEWQREAADIRSARVLDYPPESWADLIVTSYLVELAVTSRLGSFAVAAEGDSAFARLAHKVQNESKFHLVYLEGWLDVLTNGIDEDLHRSLEKRLKQFVEWWGPADVDDVVHLSGARSVDDTALLAEFREQVSIALPAFSATVDESTAVIRGGEISAELRRSGRPGIPQTLYELLRFKEPELAVP